MTPRPRVGVTLERNGLTISMSVLPEKVDEAVRELLEVVRGAIKDGYRELIVQLPGVHSGAYGDVPEDEFDEGRRRQIGFVHGASAR